MAERPKKKTRRQGDEDGLKGNRNRSEKGLAAAEERFLIILETAPEAVIIFGKKDGRVLFGNRNFFRQTGYTPKDISDGAVLAPDLLKYPRGREGLLWDSLGTEHDQKAVFRAKDGRELEVVISAAAIDYRNRECIIAFIKGTEILEKAEGRAREWSGPETYREPLIDNLPGIAFRCRNLPEMPMVFVSRGVEDLTGYSPSELTGENDLKFSKIIHPNDQSYGWEEVRQSLKKGLPYRRTYRIVTKSGQEKWVLETGAGVSSGGAGFDFLEGFIADITAQKKMEEELNVRASDLKKWLTIAPEAIAVLDNSTKVVGINPEFTNLFGFRPEEAIGRSLNDLIIPADRAGEGRLLARRAFSGNRNEVETVRRRKDGSLIQVSVLGAPTEDERGLTGIYAIYRDIGERKRADKKLADTNRELEAIFENSRVGIMLLKGNRVLTKCNRRLADILGYDSAEGMVGLGLRDLHLSEKRFKAFGEKYYNRLVKGAQTQIEYRLKKKDGSPVWCVLSGKAIDSAQPPDLSKGVLWVLDDITRRKETEAALHKSEVRYRFLVSNAPVGIFTVDTNGLIMEINDKCLEILGSPGAKETRSINVLTFPPLLEAGLSQDILRCLKDGKNIVAERPYTSKWGVSSYLRYHLTPMRDNRGRIEGAQFIMEDFTERKRAEEALRVSEARNRAIFSNVAVGVAVTDPKGEYLIVNETWADMIGYSVEELQKKTFSEVTHPDDRSDSQELRDKLWHGEIKYYQVEKRYIRQDGSTIWVETAVSPILGEGSRIEAIVAVNVDITERKSVAEEKIRREKLQGAIETAGAVCHELNQPLQALLGRVELLLMGPLRAVEKPHLECIEQEVNRMAEITRKLQRITKYETHEYMDDSKILDINKSTE